MFQNASSMVLLGLAALCGAPPEKSASHYFITPSGPAQARIGATITVKARLTYGPNVAYAADHPIRNAPVIFTRSGGHHFGPVKTDENGWAQITYKIPADPANRHSEGLAGR